LNNALEVGYAYRQDFICFTAGPKSVSMIEWLNAMQSVSENTPLRTGWCNVWAQRKACATLCALLELLIEGANAELQ
jgi:hypothetical protein